MGAIGGSGVSIEEAVPLDGSQAMTGPLLLPDGSAGAPSLSFSNATTTGLFRGGGAVLGFAAGGSTEAVAIVNQFQIINEFRLGSTGGTSVFFSADAANTLGQRNGTNAQTFNLYNTFTDASNFERLAINAASAADVQIVPEAAGTGTLRGLQLSSASGRLGFYGTTAIAKPTVTGSRAGNAALADLLTELASLGILTDSSSA